MNDQALSVVDEMIADAERRPVPAVRGKRDLAPLGSELGRAIRLAVLREVRDRLGGASVVPQMTPVEADAAFARFLGAD